MFKARLTSLFLKIIFVLLLISITVVTEAQCSICTKTAQQLGEKPAQGLNYGILYLALTPFLFAGVVGYIWWKRNRS